MTKIAYIDKRFNAKSLKTIEQANEIIVSYQRQGYTLTLRQLYYQFVSRDLLPNQQSEYKRLGSILNYARLAGMIDWSAIEDRTRNLKSYHYAEMQTPQQILESAAYGHELNRWEEQENYVEVWIEKDALVGVIERVCNDWRVPFFACRGYTSQSEQFSAGQRIIEKMNEGKHVHVLHLGDHDPSGIDMTRDNTDRLGMFINGEERMYEGGSFELHRLALNIDQVRKHNPPPNPAKDTDSRFADYIKKFGKKCWELDALNPQIITGIVADNVKSLVDMKAWKRVEKREEQERNAMLKIAESLNV